MGKHGGRSTCTRITMLLTGALTALSAHAGPWEVGGTSVDKKRKAKLEVALRDSADTRVWARPVLGYAHPIDDTMSFEITAGHGVIESPGYRVSGERDMDIKLKYQLAKESTDRLAWLIEPKLSIPVGDDDKGIGRGKYAVEIPLRASRTVRKTTYTGELRYTQVLGGGDDQKLVGLGSLIEYVPDPRWVVGIDLFADAPVNQGRNHHLRSNVAAKWRPSQAIELQALVGRSLSNRRGEDQTSYKVVLEYKY